MIFRMMQFGIIFNEAFWSPLEQLAMEMFILGTKRMRYQHH